MEAYSVYGEIVGVLVSVVFLRLFQLTSALCLYWLLLSYIKDSLR